MVRHIKRNQRRSGAEQRQLPGAFAALGRRRLHGDRFQRGGHLGQRSGRHRGRRVCCQQPGRCQHDRLRGLRQRHRAAQRQCRAGQFVLGRQQGRCHADEWHGGHGGQYFRQQQPGRHIDHGPCRFRRRHGTGIQRQLRGFESPVEFLPGGSHLEQWQQRRHFNPRRNHGREQPARLRAAGLLARRAVWQRRRRGRAERRLRGADQLCQQRHLLFDSGRRHGQHGRHRRCRRARHVLWHGRHAGEPGQLYRCQRLFPEQYPRQPVVLHGATNQTCAGPGQQHRLQRWQQVCRPSLRIR